MRQLETSETKKRYILVKNPIGIIGLGLLGRAVADRLTEKGFIVAGFDIVTPKSQEVNMLPNAVEVFNTCSTVVFSLPTRSTSLQVAAQVSKVLSPKHLVIDTATGNPEETLALANELATCGAGYLEANVAGSSEQLRNGGAALFLGGTEKVVSDCQPLLDALTTRRFHIGSVGAASQFKLVHNLILGLHRATLAEGLQFAEALGLEPGTVLEILRQTPAISGVMDTKGLKMVKGDYQPPQARLSQHLKDVCLILREARRIGAITPLSKVHHRLLERAEELGYGGVDNAAIVEAFRSPGQADSG